MKRWTSIALGALTLSVTAPLSFYTAQQLTVDAETSMKGSYVSYDDYMDTSVIEEETLLDGLRGGFDYRFDEKSIDPHISKLDPEVDDIDDLLASLPLQIDDQED